MQGLRIAIISIFIFIAVIVLGIFLFGLIRNGIGNAGGGSDVPEGNVLVIKSIDGGATWQAASSVDMQSNLPRNRAFKLALLTSKPQQDDALITVTDGGGLFKSTSGASEWVQLGGENQQLLNKGDLTGITTKVNGDGVAYITHQKEGESGVLRVDTNTQELRQVFVVSSQNDRVTASAIDQNDSNIITIGTSEGALVQSDDRGETWRTLQVYKDPIVQLVTSNQNSQALYMTTGRALFKSFDRGVSWEEITRPLRDAQPGRSRFDIIGMAADPSDSLTLYAVTKEHLLRTRNGGSSWELILLPSSSAEISINSIAVQPTDANVIYVSSGSTIYKSTDGGATWQLFPIDTTQLILNLVVSISNPEVLYATVLTPQKPGFFGPIDLR